MKTDDVKPKILLWDIESSYNLLYTFSLDQKDKTIPYDNIVTERYIFCISYKWFGEKTIHTISITDYPNFKQDIHDDFFVIKDFRDILEQADAYVGHYADNFDLPMLNARILRHGLDPLPKIIGLDTCKIARKYFRLNSNKLDYLAKYLGLKGKIHNSSGLWRECFEGNRQALKDMIKYNRQDVKVLEDVFIKLIPFVKNHPVNMNMFLRGARCPNPTCGSFKLQSRGFRYTKLNKYQRFQCTDCGTWCDSREATPYQKVLVR